jgi:hypothetical protein
MRGDAGDVYGSRGDVDKEQDVMRDKASECENFDAQGEVGVSPARQAVKSMRRT